ncbi:S8 family peptidase [Pseudoduganella namucuonensis]|uniref:Subtilase family protein n=1 Tax=Pseudoduganella namucuonensis TaxID=1035707 RepID=A0A1I7JHE2_9BURK|nr:S8 family serine peptidase [Pseudoduganella namucuonensis]SFU84623.1 Subtilase family protein [Pseudoduganella namucuonensis]
MSSYIVLKRRSPSAGAGIGATRALEVRNAGGGTDSFEMRVERVDRDQAARIAADPDVKVVARTMPTALIEPVDFTPGAPATPADAEPVWGISFVGADRSGFTGSGVSVAVLDTGIDSAHPAFAGVNVIEEDFSGAGNGDRLGHGTHCAGTIMGRDVDGKRIGVARGVERALIGKVLGDDGSGESEMLFRGLQWALDNDANIISMSLGFNFPGLVELLVSRGWPVALATSTALESYRGNLRMFDAIMDMFRANAEFGGSPMVIAAAGNESRRGVSADFKIAASLPAASVNVSVAAVNQAGEVAPFSNCFALVCAPGVGITSAWPGNQLNTISGTSMACPHVAGLAALWWQQQTDEGLTANPVNVQARLLATLRRDPLRPAFNEIDFGQGLVTAPE